VSKKWRVPGESGRASRTTSASASIAYRSPGPPIRSKRSSWRGARPTAATAMPRSRARRAAARPMGPGPTARNRLPARRPVLRAPTATWWRPERTGPPRPLRPPRSPGGDRRSPPARRPRRAARSQRLPVAEPRGRLVVPGDLVFTQPPAEVHLAALALGREVDQPDLGVTQEDPALGQVLELGLEGLLVGEPPGFGDPAPIARHCLLD